jgi:phage shock protein A
MVGVNAVPTPGDPSLPQGAPSISASADRARAQLHEEIERVRMGVEEMLAEQRAPDPQLQRELNDLREDTRLYVKKRIRKTEKRLERSIGRMEDRTDQLEARIDQVEADRVAAEHRIHSDTERLLEELLQEVRAIADLLSPDKEG